MMTAWNSDSGASIVAELLARQWSALGHDLTVFSFYKSDFHGSVIGSTDEDYVRRCFTTWEADPPRLDLRMLLKHRYDIFVFNDIGMLPYQCLPDVLTNIDSSTRVVNLFHNHEPFTDPVRRRFRCDAVTCFDSRYKDFLVTTYPAETIEIIPLPCLNEAMTEPSVSRRTLNLPASSKIIFTLRHNDEEHLDFLAWTDEYVHVTGLPLVVVLLTRDAWMVRRYQHRFSFDLRVLRSQYLPIRDLWHYFNAADITVFNKRSAPGVLSSTSVCLALGSCSVVLARKSNYVDLLDEELFKYESKPQFFEALDSALQEDARCRSVRRCAAEYVNKHAARKVAQRYLELFERLRTRP